MDVNGCWPEKLGMFRFAAFRKGPTNQRNMIKHVDFLWWAASESFSGKPTRFPGYDTCDQDDKGCLLVFKHVLFHPQSLWWLQRFSHIPQSMACRWLPKHLHHCPRTIGVYVLEPLWTAMTITFSWVLPQTWDSHLRFRAFFTLWYSNQKWPDIAMRNVEKSTI